jgi:hypothetical protein
MHHLLQVVYVWLMWKSGEVDPTLVAKGGTSVELQTSEKQRPRLKKNPVCCFLNEVLRIVKYFEIL